MASAALDTLVGVETPEGIALTLRPAGMMSRSLAYLIDIAIRLALLIGATTLLSALGRMGFGIFLILVFALEWLYPVVFELMPGAATPGKRAMGLCVVMDSGLPVTPAAALVRNLLRTIDLLPGCYAVGLLMLVLRPDFKRIGDLAAGTLVVHRQAIAWQGQLPEAQPLAPSRPLTLREQAAVIGWAGRASRLTHERWVELAALAAPAVGPVGELPGHDTHTTDPERTARRLAGVAQWLIGRR